MKKEEGRRKEEEGRRKEEGGRRKEEGGGGRQKERRSNRFVTTFFSARR